MSTTRRSQHIRQVVVIGALLVVMSCSSTSDGDASLPSTSQESASVPTASSEDPGTESTEAAEVTPTETVRVADEVDGASETGDESDGAAVACDATAALFVTGESANPELDDPEVAATCDGETITVVSNGVPDFTYIGTSPGAPDGREFVFTLPAEATVADTVTDIPYVGPIGVTLGGIAMYGPTEGTGGDVDSLPGIISACGSHNGPGGFHTHKILNPSETDCWFTPEEVAEEPQLVGYAFDGFPIYTGIDQYTSSWQLTDETLFASDTWAAHTYVEGSGDLDQCNGRTDAEGNYAYYTTEAFPYLLGCFIGQVEIEGPGAGDDDDRPERPDAGDDGERPERPDAGEDGERPERPDAGEDGERPERPDAGEDGERPEPPDAAEDGEAAGEAPGETDGEQGG